MFNSRSIPDNFMGTNGDWYGTDGSYPAGMIWEGTMFTAGRNEIIWGPQDPLEVVGPASPFDKVGENSWRVTNRGRHIYTGEAIVRSKCPDDEQQKYQTEYWEDYDSQKAQPVTMNVKVQEQEENGTEQDTDALFTLPCHTVVFAPICNNDVWQPALQASVALQVNSPGDCNAEILVSSDDANGKFKEDNEYFHGGSQSYSDSSDDLLPDSTLLKTSSPRGIDDWDDDNLLSLWKWKTIRKKGYEPMMAYFQGQTVNTLVETWNTHKKRCEELGAAWREAGKPATNIAE